MKCGERRDPSGLAGIVCIACCSHLVYRVAWDRLCSSLEPQKPGLVFSQVRTRLGISLPELDDSLLPLSLGGPGKSMTTWLEA